MTRIRLLHALLPGILAGTVGLQPAHADIYTWVDVSGSLNVSNLAPPEGVRVTGVTRAPAPPAAKRDDIARDEARQAEVQALAERVRQLESAVEFAQRPTPAAYQAIPPPPVVQYIVEMAPPEQYVGMPPAANTGCYSGWPDCGLPWWASGIYPASVIVLPVPNFRRHGPGRGGHQFGVQPLMHAAAGIRRG